MDFTVNDDLSAYSPEEIADLIERGNEALAALFAVPEPTDEQVAEAERVVAAIDDLTAEQAARSTRTDRMAALRAAHVEATATPEEASDEEAAEEDAEEDEAEEEAPAQPVQASVKPTARQALARRTARPVVPQRSSLLTITAAADVPGFTTGGSIESLVNLAEATINRMRGFPDVYGVKGAQMSNYPVATYRLPFEDDMVIDRSTDDYEVIERAAKEARLPGGSLVAAGGWCAPSETLYDFCSSATTDGLVDLPTVQASRGGIRTTPGPDFSTVYNNATFCQTEAQAIAGTAKPCYEVACPTFTDTRLDACGVCIKVPILTNAAYPELVARVISDATIAHQHKISAQLLSKMVTAAGAAVAVADIKSVAAGTLDAVELVANTSRQAYRLGFAETLEVIAPFWLKGAIRADLADRGGVDLLAVSDAQIDSYFGARGVSVQWIYNWQPLAVGEEGYPTTVQVLIYPAGTFVKATNNVISLSAVYDAAGLSLNTYTGLFFEEGVAVVNRCYTAKLVTIPVCAGGVTGAMNNTNCFNLT